MSTYTRILYQIVFGAKNITVFLDNQNKKILFNYIAGIIRKRNSIPCFVGGHGNHIHIVSSLHPSVCLADMVHDIKIASNRMMKNNSRQFRDFPCWQIGYAAITYNLSSKDHLVRYVENQENHHRYNDFRREYIGLLEENKIKYDPDHLFD